MVTLHLRVSPPPPLYTPPAPLNYYNDQVPLKASYQYHQHVRPSTTYSNWGIYSNF